jgi:two-component system sensor histidine kinase RegB
VTIPLVEHFFHIDLNLMPLLLIVCGLALFNVFVWKRLNNNVEVSDNTIFRHLLIDVAALTVVLYFTGGASNPFITLFMFPLIISVTILPARFGWILAGVAIASYSVLMFQYMPLDMKHTGHNLQGEFNLHIIGMWMAFVFSAGFVAHFVVKMGSTIRSQDALLIKAREDALRDKQIIELGTLAASTAHELGTPLATMNLLTSELLNEIKGASPQVNRDLNLLKQQIDRCKDALSNLSASAGAINISSGTITPVAEYLGDVLMTWQSVRQDAMIKTHWDENDLAVNILDDRTLTQAIMNILDNAQDASPQDVEWDAEWNEAELTMELRDRGHGLSDDLKDKLGKTPLSQEGHHKEKGLGLGLFLSHSIIERFGGSVNLSNREGGGMTTRIVIPLLAASENSGSSNKRHH